MKKAFLSFLFVISILSTTFFPVLAQNSSSSSSILLGQKHYYSVFFRGNGEAVVLTKVVLTNSTDKVLTDFSFVTNQTIYEESAFQIKLADVCVKYDIPVYSRCLAYGEADYDNYYSNSWANSTPNQESKKIDLVSLSSEQGKYVAKLSYPIDPGKSTAVMLSFATKDYAKAFLGEFVYKFTSLAVSERVQKINVAINVDSDIYLKNATSTVNYNDTENLKADFSKLASASASSSIARIYSQIGTSGMVTKNASNLAPNETYSVSGEYSSNYLRLYLNEIVISICVIIFLIILGAVVSFFRKKMSKDETASSTNNSKSFFNFWNIIVAFISALLIVVFTIGFEFVRNFLLGSNFYPYGYYNQFNSVLTVVLLIIQLLLYMALLFGPAIYMYTKQKWKGFWSVILFEVFWLVVLSILAFSLFAGFYHFPEPIPVAVDRPLRETMYAE